MYWEDHTPYHFHAQYGNDKALISIKDAVVFKGSLPSRQLKLVLAWCELHEKELWAVPKTILYGLIHSKISSSGVIFLDLGSFWIRPY